MARIAYERLVKPVSGLFILMIHEDHEVSLITPTSEDEDEEATEYAEKIFSTTINMIYRIKDEEGNFSLEELLKRIPEEYSDEALSLLLQFHEAGILELTEEEKKFIEAREENS